MKIKQFDFHGANVRTITDESGEPWFILKDVCALLDLTISKKGSMNETGIPVAAH